MNKSPSPTKRSRMDHRQHKIARARELRVDGLSLADIADRLGATIGQVNSWLTAPVAVALTEVRVRGIVREELEIVRKANDAWFSGLK